MMVSQNALLHEHLGPCTSRRRVHTNPIRWSLAPPCRVSQRDFVFDSISAQTISETRYARPKKTKPISSETFEVSPRDIVKVGWIDPRERTQSFNNGLVCSWAPHFGLFRGSAPDLDDSYRRRAHRLCLE